MNTSGTLALSRRIPYQHLAGWSIGIAVALVVVSVQLAIIVEWLRRQTSILEFVGRGLPGRTGLDPIHSRLTLWTAGAALVLAVGFVLWVVWSYQAGANLRAAGEPTGRKPRNAITSWAWGLVFALPIVSMGLLWRRSEPYEPEPGRRQVRTSPLLWLWWAALVTTLILVLGAYSEVPLQGATPRQLIRRNNLLVPACLAGIATAALSIVLVIRIEGRIHLKTEDGDWQSWTERERGAQSAVGSN